ncbi:MAG: PSD1 and planctomycete cytochrome C domain-containing protein [Verrucomicrobiota bacterium]
MKRLLPAVLLAASLQAAVDFNREVRPILAQHCFACHGMDEHSREGELRLDLQETAHKSGESGATAIVPGDPAKSEVVRRIFTEDKDDLMPPPKVKKPLSEKDKEVLRRWIAEGGKYEAHWAFAKPVQPTPPDASIHPVDAFVRTRLAKEGLRPSPEADRHTLIRRLSLDLTGLPPTPEEADAFAADSSPQAYENLVERLLASPRYGERWARRWLDLARYADTNGFEKDRPRTIWPYRDWVVKALNEDMPYDQFGIRQLAGDLLPGATPDDVIATGFHRNTMLNEEGGIDPNEYRFYAMVDRVGTTGAAFMGLTMNCAQCHTHKYDPIVHTDYYSVMALLNNADEPTYFIPPADLEAQKADHARQIAQAEAALPGKFPGGAQALEARLDAWIAEQKPRASRWKIVRPSSMKTTLPHPEAQPDGFILGGGDITKSDVYDLAFSEAVKGATAVRIEVAHHPALPNDGPGLTNYEGPLGGFFLSEIQAWQGERRLAMGDASATNDEEEDRISDATAAPKAKAKAGAKAKAVRKKNNADAALDGEMSSGWQVLGGYGQKQTAVFRFAQPTDLTSGWALKMLFEKHFACPLGHFRISVTTDPQATATGHPAAVEDMLAGAAPADRDLLRKRFLETAPEVAPHAKALEALRKRIPRGQSTLAMRERPASNPRPTFRHHRGEFLSPREEVRPAVPAFLPQLPKDTPANRLTFARWLFSPENPLTARVAVNRHWQAFFGRGFVTTLEDFGFQSEAPSHPELLDWLAVEFMKSGWSTKRLHRLIVTSATYRQSSKVSPESSAKDPSNVLLSRGSRFRLEAEIIRDSSLKAAGLLSAKMGGPGVYPPQPASVTTEGTYGKVEWKTSEGEDRYRRSLYTFIKRTAPFAMSTTFDAPTGESCVARRDVSNSPLQALTLLNDEMFMETARALGQKAMETAADDDGRIAYVLRRCVTRPPASDETAALKAFVKNLRDRKTAEKDVWTALARAALNLDETVVHP